MYPSRSTLFERFKKNAFVALFTETFGHWIDHDALRLGAALSYYTVFTLAPLTILVIAFVSLFVDRSLVEAALLGQVGAVIGVQGREFIQSVLVSSSRPQSSIIAIIIGFITLTIGAIAILGELKYSMDELWNFPHKKVPEDGGILGYIKGRVLSLSLIPVLSVLLLASVLFSAALHSASSYLRSTADFTTLFNLFDIVFSYIIVTLLFAFIYRFLPQIKLPWKETLLGAAITALFFTVGKILIGLYLAKIASLAAFGSASALVIIMVWTYYSIQIFFIGASLTYVYSCKYGYLRNPRL